MNREASDWPVLGRLALLLIIGAFCLYLPTLFHGFFADDDTYLAFSNRLLRDTPWHEVHRLLLERANPWEYLPLRDFTYWLDFRLYETEGVGFHASNLIWYGLSALAAGALFRELILLFRPAWSHRASTLALCGVATFVVHPAHVEAVAWVASRKDLLAAALAFLSAAVLVRGMRQGWPLASGSLAAVLLLLACFSKAAGMAMLLFQSVLLMAAWRHFPEVSRWRRLAPLAWLSGVVVFAAWVHMATGEATGIRIENAPGVWLVAERASRIATSLLGLVLFPSDLGLYHDVYALGDWHWAVTALGLLAVLSSFFVLLRKQALWPLGVLLIVSPWAVYLQFIPFTTWSLASERFVFVSVAGLALILIDVFGTLRPRPIMVLLALLTIPAALATWQRVGDWEYSVSLRTKEYERLPAFHNAIRDRVLYALLPQGNYKDAETLAASVRRPYAADVLLAMVALERASKELGNWRAGADSERWASFCRALVSLRHVLAAASSAIRTEPDISYNNLVLSIERQIKIRFPEMENHCSANQR